MILGIDPGSARSAWVIYDDGVVRMHGITENAALAQRLILGGFDPRVTLLAVEMVQSFGMPVGRDIFETVLWTGRFVQAHWPGEARLIYRSDVKLHLCGSMRAKDANVRQALIDLLGKPGTKRQPGPTYGLRGDEWSALAVALMARLKTANEELR